MRYQAIMAGAVLGLLGMAAVGRANIVTVTPGNMGNWTYYETDSSGALGTGTGTGQMVNGPSTPPLGTGSANLVTPAGGGDQSVQLRNAGDWAGTKISSLTALSYSTYASAWNGQQLPYLTIYIDTNNDGIRDDRLWFEPAYSGPGAGNGNPSPQAAVALNTWQNWNLLTGMWYDDNGVGGAGPGANAKSLSYILSNEPNFGTIDATIVDASPGVGGIRLASGFASPGDSFNANVDAFTIGTSAGTTTYDFELTPAPEPASLAVLAVGGLLLFRRRRAS